MPGPARAWALLLPKTLLPFLYVLSADGIASGHAYNCGNHRSQNIAEFSPVFGTLSYSEEELFGGPVQELWSVWAAR